MERNGPLFAVATNSVGGTGQATATAVLADPINDSVLESGTSAEHHRDGHGLAGLDRRTSRDEPAEVIVNVQGTTGSN